MAQGTVTSVNVTDVNVTDVTRTASPDPQSGQQTFALAGLQSD